MTFDDVSFFATVERRRQAEGLSWRELGRKLDLSASTFSRLSRGRRPDLDTFLKLLGWLEMPAEAFMVGRESPSAARTDTLAEIAASLRRDPELRPDDIPPLEEIVRVAYNSLRRVRR